MNDKASSPEGPAGHVVSRGAPSGNPGPSGRAAADPSSQKLSGVSGDARAAPGLLRRLPASGFSGARCVPGEGGLRGRPLGAEPLAELEEPGVGRAGAGPYP